MNALIATYPKPLVSISHGITMGGGIGIAGHCGVRVTQPGARYAMPESAIGFFADVGVNAILSQAPLNRALLFLLSGVSVGASDAVALGLADAVVAPERIETLAGDLVAAAGSSEPRTAIVRLLSAETIVAGEAPFCALADQLPAAEPDSPADFVEAVAATPALSEIAGLAGRAVPGVAGGDVFAQDRARRGDGRAQDAGNGPAARRRDGAAPRFRRRRAGGAGRQGPGAQMGAGEPGRIRRGARCGADPQGARRRLRAAIFGARTGSGYTS